MDTANRCHQSQMFTPGVCTISDQRKRPTKVNEFDLQMLYPLIRLFCVELFRWHVFVKWNLCCFSFDKLICGHTNIVYIQCTSRSEERMAFFRRKTEIHNKAHGPGKQNVFWIYFATSPFSCCNLETSADALFFGRFFWVLQNIDLMHMQILYGDFVSINCASVNKVTEKLDSKLWVVRAWIMLRFKLCSNHAHTHNNTIIQMMNESWVQL